MESQERRGWVEANSNTVVTWLEVEIDVWRVCVYVARSPSLKVKIKTLKFRNQTPDTLSLEP